MFMRSIKIVVGWIVCLLLLACDHVDEITPNKYVALIDSMAAPLRGEIVRALTEYPMRDVPMAGKLNPSILKNLPIEVTFGWVTRRGVVIIYSEEYKVTYVREPILVNERIKWSCTVHPVRARPNLCGNEE